MKVLTSYGELRDDANPFLALLEESVGSEVTWVPFRFRTALIGGYDIFHVHWPEAMVERRTRMRTSARQALLALMLMRMRASRTPIVRTLHNSQPHERISRFSKKLLRMLDNQTSVTVMLSQSQSAPSGQHRVIPHGHYMAWYEKSEEVSQEGSLLYFGLIRPYKGITSLMRSFAQTKLPTRLDILGRPYSDEMADELARTAKELTDPRVHLTLGHIDESDLVSAIGRAELVVLPYERLENSGALLMALSLGRPVLAPSTPTTQALAAEVGDGWIFPYDQMRPQASIDGALRLLRSVLNRPAPDLSGRDWEAIGRQHVEVYKAALAQKRGPAG